MSLSNRIRIENNNNKNNDDNTKKKKNNFVYVNPELIWPSTSSLLIGETTNQLKRNQVKSNQRLVFVESRKPEHPEINVSARTQ